MRRLELDTVLAISSSLVSRSVGNTDCRWNMLLEYKLYFESASTIINQETVKAVKILQRTECYADIADKQLNEHIDNR